MFAPSNPIGVHGVRSPSDVNAVTFTEELISDTGDTYNVHPISIQIEVTEANGVTVPATISIGTAPNFNNIVPLATVGGVVSLQNLLSQGVKIPINTEIKVKKVTNSIATAHKFRVALLGYITT